MIEKLKDRYELLRKIGSGGMSIIYLANEIATGNEVAIKLMKQSSAKTYKEKQRFTQEIEVLKKVKSEYIVKFIEGECNDDQQYIVMEHIAGGTLKQYIKKRGSLSQEEAVEFSKQLALGFDKIHQAGIIHRDIKSSNIIVSDHGQMKIIDFGIALEDESVRVTATNSVVGSPQYIAPEMVDGEEPSVQTDIYALGILMFEMLEGRTPFSGKQPIDVLTKHRSGRVPRLSRINAAIAESLSNVVMKATSKDLSVRYKNMYELYTDLSTVFSAQRRTEAPVPSGMLTRKNNFKDIVNSGLVKWSIIIIAALLVILVAVVTTILVVG